MHFSRKDIGMHAEALTHLLSNNSNAIAGMDQGVMEIVLIAVGLISVLFAFFAFRLLRIETCLLGIATGIALGFSTFEMALENPLAGYIALVISVGLSIVGVILALKLYRIMVYVNSTILIYAVVYVILALVLGLIFSNLDMKPISAFLSIAITIPVAANLKKYFKQIFIVTSSLGNSILAALCFSLLIPYEYNHFVWLIILAAPVLAAFSMRLQFRTTDHLCLD